MNNKSIQKIIFPLLIGCFFIIITSCGKDEDPNDTNEIPTTVTDFDGNIYQTVKIGTQTWLTQDLKVTHYTDGTLIPLVTNNAAWSSLLTPGYCWYDNDEITYGETYGVLYNWYAANTGKLCPTDWHVPTDAEWLTLTTYLGGEDIAGGKLKEAGTAHWISPNTGANDEVGFKALPGGHRGSDGVFEYLQYRVYWWSSSQGSIESAAFSRRIFYNENSVGKNQFDTESGYCVRCIKD
jgi:uncharacterized protein (TIGR02145 family)